MKVAKESVVAINYTLTNNAGTILDSSSGRDPLTYIQGIGALIPGLEAELNGKSAGDKLKVSIKPEDGYGLKDDSLIQVISRNQFEKGLKIELGMQFETATPDGHGMVVTVVEVNGDNIKVDGNHPLAGEVLNFDVEIMSVRAATAEELSHGHVHGPHGHHHH
ncbi:MAG: peptidylprolyl isomerase [Bacteriovoracaceae bacterium]